VRREEKFESNSLKSSSEEEKDKGKEFEIVIKLPEFIQVK